MSEDTRDYLKKRGEQLRLDRGENLELIQAELDQRYPREVRALSLNDGVLRLITPTAAVASELRLNQVELLATFKQKTGENITRLAISIRSL